MKSTRFGCLSSTSILAALLTILLVTGVGLARGGGMFNPGDLNAQTGSQTLEGVQSHAETRGRCAACHTAIWERDTMADRCLVCHAHLMQDSQGFHALMLAQSRELTCNHCHTDHRGSDAPLTVLDMGRFPHNDAASYSLIGHTKMADGTDFVCADCHGTAIASFELAVCESCHRSLDGAYMQTHLADFGPQCLECHDGKDTYGDDFDHNQQDFRLEGKHADAGCADCHSGAVNLADLRGAPQDCNACHADDDEHQGQLGIDCAQCHTTADWEQVTFDHSQTAYPLEGEHIEAACVDCHAGGIFKDTPQDCFACHSEQDAHTGQLGQDCAACHTPLDWEDATFDHASSDFPLTGAHISVACEGCHVDRVYSGLPQDCVGCHVKDDTHQGQFGDQCAACHVTDSWEQVTFDHAQSAFPLTGAHSRAECTKCHTNAVFKGTPTACVSCHADPAYHRSLFGTDCAACHETSTWIPGQFNQSHRFPMNHGEGGRSQCRVCHPDSLSAYTCYGCHEHTPGGIATKHREEGISDFNNCVRCHPTGREEEGEGGDD